MCSHLVYHRHTDVGCTGIPLCFDIRRMLYTGTTVGLMPESKTTNCFHHCSPCTWLGNFHLFCRRCSSVLINIRMLIIRLLDTICYQSRLAVSDIHGWNQHSPKVLLRKSDQIHTNKSKTTSCCIKVYYNTM